MHYVSKIYLFMFVLIIKLLFLHCKIPKDYMKFTKEEAYKELVAKMTTNGETLNLSERSVNEQLENLIGLIANDDTEMSDFVDKILPFIKTADANVRNDVAQGIKNFTEKKPKEKVKEKPTVTTQTSVDNAILERLEAMEKALEESKTREKKAQVKTDILTRLKEKGVKNEEWAVALLEEISITEDFDVDSKVDSYVKLYNKSNADTGHQTPNFAGGGDGKNEQLKNSIKAAADFAKSQNLV